MTLMDEVNSDEVYEGTGVNERSVSIYTVDYGLDEQKYAETVWAF